MKKTTSPAITQVVGKLILASAISLGITGIANANQLQSQILSFEEARLPSFVQNHHSELTQLRAIHGEQSLLWHWQQGDTLTIDHSFERMTDAEATRAYGRGATQVLSFWLYNPVAVDDTMTVVLSDEEGRESTDLKIQMNFTGWRAVGVSLNADFKPAVTDHLAKLTFHAPTALTESAAPLFIDRVMVSVDDKRYQWSDHQVTTRYDIPEIDFGLPDTLPVPTQTELDDAKTIQSQLIKQYSGSSGNFASLEKRFNAFNIQKDAQDVITGRHIVSGYQKTIYQPDHLLPADKAAFDEYAEISDYTDLMLDLAKAYHDPSFKGDCQQVATMYRLMTEHLLDQGYTEGSSLVTTHHWGYGARWWYISALMMADELKKHDLLKPTYDALVWFSREFKESFDMVLSSQSSDLDYLNTLSNQHLALLLLNPDVRERVALLHKFSAFFSDALSQTPPGYHDGFRPDGTAWRHKGHYPGYAFHAFKRAALVAYVLKRSSFALETQALDSLKSVMVAGWRYSNPYVPLALSGRHPFGKLGVMHYQSGLEYLAKAYPTLDQELASIFLQVTNTPQAQSQSIFGQSVAPAKLPQGSWSFNGGGFVVHRYGDRMAVLKGYNKDVWSSEIYYKDNRYGRYQSHGSVHVMPYGDPEQFGYQQEGWDWNRNPGATSIHLDYDQLESPNKHSLMVRSEEGISGATTLNERFSLFTFKHKAPSDIRKFESTFEAEKHVMAVDDKLFLTGNGIRNADGHHQTETTLFQLAIGEPSKGIWINGVRHQDENFSETLGSGDWIIDDNGVGYYLKDVGTVHVRCGPQQSRHDKTKQATFGEFSTAWIDHGRAPEDARYEYVMVMQTNPEDMAVFAAEMKRYPYFVTRKTDDHGMYIRNRTNNLFGYSSTGHAEFKYGPLRSLSTTAQALIQLKGEAAYLSVASPELMLHETEPTPTVSIDVVVKGLWKMEGADYFYQGENTVITVESFFGESVNLTLSKFH
ncbi:chondroitinase family polysaccharide lyase [Photobacterium sp. TY1-4]|uniref:chondroitinase family polysaccharide lyase n=1 Tax=Photobacterium sp. TY1-4 TaxID=2899122 RepID=UPI0021BFA3BB|nr:chondroitinase family polysaccharide lyase [Photobacterium sp. TY1-4]UXI00129.1 hypothetical protein NH461_09860 [Photobacterium sp. TY1-4]